MNVTGSHDVHASDKVSISAPNSISLTVGGTSIVLTPSNITLHTCGTTLKLDFGVDALSEGGGHLHLDGNAFMEGKGGASMFLSNFAKTVSKSGCTVALDSDLIISSDATVSIDGAKIAATGKSEAGMNGGGSSLALTAASADMKGATVNIAGDGSTSIVGAIVKIN